MSRVASPADDLEVCGGCRWRYPSELLAPYVSNGKTLLRCGICALEESNRLHGIRRTTFGGGMAEDMRLDAIDWREGHRDSAPR